MPATDIFSTMKRRNEKIAAVTAYDASTARFAVEAGADILLVGDSVGVNILGYAHEREVTLADMTHHIAAVRRGAPRPTHLRRWRRRRKGLRLFLCRCVDAFPAPSYCAASLHRGAFPHPAETLKSTHARVSVAVFRTRRRHRNRGRLGRLCALARCR